MSPRKLRLLEDKALRDAAKANFTTDVELIKADAQEQGPAKRLAEAGSEYAQIFADGAADVSQANKGKFATGILLGVVGLAAWFFREPILDAIDGFLGEAEDDDAEPMEAERIAEEEKQTLSGAE